MFRESVQAFLEREIKPHYSAWEERGWVDREAWLAAGRAGFLCMTVPEAYGGAGADFLYSAILIEEQWRAGCPAPGYYTHSDIVAPYIANYAGEPLKQRWLPPMASGEVIAAIAMTEPEAGSDLKALRTTAVKDGEDYLINGGKTFISNGWLADMVVVAAKTDPASGAKGISLFVVETGRPGFHKGRRLEKLGQKAQDTAELFFENVRVPAGNMIGEPNRGFAYLMNQLAQERLAVAIAALGGAKGAYSGTLDYVRSRNAFGRPVAEFQNTQFQLATCKTEIAVGEAFVDRCLELLVQGELPADSAAMAKLWLTDMQARVVDTCLQLHGGYGYMLEYPVARAYADARAQRIYAGTNEIMKLLIARNL